jgi:hypothetical protein
VHQLASWWLILIRADLLLHWPLILLFCLAGVFFEELYLPSQPSLSTAFSSFDRVARFSRAFACVRVPKSKLDSIVQYDIYKVLIFFVIYP